MVTMQSKRFYSAISSITGFTLIELLLSIALMGIVAGIGGIQLYGVYERNKVNDVTAEITTALDRARTLALANNQLYQPTSSTSTCHGETHPYVTDVGVFVHNDGSTHDHIHIRYIFNCSDPALPGPSPLMSPSLPPGTWYYQDSYAGGWTVQDITEDDFPANIALSSSAFENKGVFFQVLNGQIDYKPGGSIDNPALLPGPPATSRFVQVQSTQAGIYYDICVYPNGRYVTNQSQAGQNTCH